MRNSKAKLYIMPTEAMSEEVRDFTGYGDVFATDDGDIIEFVHENDGGWREEYFNPILNHFNIIVEHPDNRMMGIIEDKFKDYIGVE